MTGHSPQMSMPMPMPIPIPIPIPMPTNNPTKSPTGLKILQDSRTRRPNAQVHSCWLVSATTDGLLSAKICQKSVGKENDTLFRLATLVVARDVREILVQALPKVSVDRQRASNLSLWSPSTRTSKLRKRLTKLEKDVLPINATSTTATATATATTANDKLSHVDPWETDLA
jgi:hypothetical protein